MGKVTLQDVAVHAGVSMKTVSNVVRGYRHVSEPMRDRVQAAIDELGYRPNVSGRTLATGRSNMLAFAFPDLRRPYFAELAHVFSRVCAERGYQLLLEETGDSAEGERSAVRGREAGVVDGVVIHPQVLSPEAIDAIRGDTAVVFLGEDVRPRSADQVAIDNAGAAAEAVAHLAALGCRRIGFFGHETGPESRTSSFRLDGYRAGLADAGIATEFLVPREVGDAIGAEVAFGRALDEGLDVDGLLCRDDLAAVGVLRAMRLRGLEAPRDIAVIGWDAIGLGSSLAPSLTSVAPDTVALAETALDLLAERIDGVDLPGRYVTVGHRLLVGESAPYPDGSVD
ncbi:LacI family DNA-binding transcriptional regulator [Curtobacterium pusillum]|uniref:LacI family DNA-binding transcriptional regulator n=1 Tax=Curtobacterium pusillum TaxID=69373 RepID=A0ABX2MHR5_9MICO|nr:LacI family DNA-binding transcriptional regulator [Curtobacterium pusillum]NUU15019.1 LacI family DNA-binding transcriptional regulator [Curtobacterium pusillum]GLK32581.1 LacI family transcriptional regulator [Curtobacterium pusillum]